MTFTTSIGSGDIINPPVRGIQTAATVEQPTNAFRTSSLGLHAAVTSSSLENLQVRIPVRLTDSNRSRTSALLVPHRNRREHSAGTAACTVGFTAPRSSFVF